MSEEVQNVTTPEPAQGEKSAPTATAPVTTGGKTFTETEVEQMIKDRLDRERTKREKAAQDAASKAAEEAAKQQGEWEKVAKANEQKAAQLEAQLRAREVADLKRSIAEKVGLPAALAPRPSPLAQIGRASCRERVLRLGVRLGGGGGV